MTTEQNAAPAWLPLTLIGAEGDEGDDQSGEEGTEGEDESGDDEGAKNGSQGSEHDDADDENVKGLKSALDKERKRAAAVEKENKRLKKLQDAADLEKKTDIEQANIKAEQAEAKATKLAAGMLKRDVDSAIRKAARDAGFIDLDDALAGVDRDSIVVSQDDDDPSEIEVDEKTVIAAVKKLASRKAHFIKSGTDDGQPSGSQFGGGSKKNKGNLDEAALAQKYPGL